MEVLDYEHERQLSAQPAEQGQQELEEPRLGELLVARGRLSLARLREQPAELAAGGAGELDEPLGTGFAAQLAKRADDRRVGQLTLSELEAFAGEDAGACGAGARGELGHQTALARPRTRRPRTAAKAPPPAARASASSKPASSLGAADEGRAGYAPHTAIIHPRVAVRRENGGPQAASARRSRRSRAARAAAPAWALAALHHVIACRSPAQVAQVLVPRSYWRVTAHGIQATAEGVPAHIGNVASTWALAARAAIGQRQASSPAP